MSLIGFFTLAKYRSAKVAAGWLTIASLIFYGYWNPAYLALLAISILFNHQIGDLIGKSKAGSRTSKILLWTGISFNLALIGYYKYAGLFLSSFNSLFQRSWPIPQILLPLAISFYTFTQIAYLVDAYRGETKNVRYDLPTYALFVSFFPQLIAGPILRHDELIPQLRQKEHFIFSHKNMTMGLVLFTLGLSKKVLIADNLSPWVAPIFANADNVTFIEAWVGALSYTFQLYFDFSGYCDMAIALGWMFNINLPLNFNSPYKATSITDFWRRWHITLSNFLRDYLYILLGGSRKGEARRYANLLITMLLGGLWHGAGWTFVVWGGLHGVYLSINHGWRKLKIPLPKAIAWGITFLAVVFGWVLFRASSFSSAIALLKTMLGFNGILIPGNPKSNFYGLSQLGIKFGNWEELNYLPQGNAYSLIVLLGLILAVTLLPNTQQIMEKFKLKWWSAALIGCMMAVSLLSLNRVSEFLYFQF